MAAPSSNPLGVPKAVTAWFDKAFKEVLDSRAPDAGEQLAKLFTADASVHSLVGVSRGTEEIIATRADNKVWKGVRSREHSLFNIYTLNEDFSDVLARGRMQMEFENGNKTDEEFVVRVTFEKDGADAVKASYWRPFADSAPYFKAMTPAA